MAFPIDERTRVALTAFGLFCLSMFLTAQSARNPSIASSGGAIVSEILSPLQGLNRWTQGGIADVWRSYVALMGVREENVRLTERLAVLEAENSAIVELRNEVQDLRALLSISSDLPLSKVAARVIGYDATQWVQSVTIDRGTQNGIREGMAVIERSGLVGQVIVAGPTTSRVLLLSDPASGVDGVIQSSRARGIVQGAGGLRCTWQFVLKEDEVTVGDRVVTSGLDGIYPRGISIGIVSAIDSRASGLFRVIEVTPAVDITMLDHVLVITSLSPERTAVAPLSRVGSADNRVVNEMRAQ